MKKKQLPTQNKPVRRSGPRYKTRKGKFYVNGVVSETLPGTRFKVKLQLKEGVDPVLLECNLLSLLKLKRVKIIKGDTVAVELDPGDISKGIIVSRS